MGIDVGIGDAHPHVGLKFDVGGGHYAQGGFINVSAPTPKALRKTARQLEKQIKHDKRRQREQAKQTKAAAKRERIALKALVRVANDPEFGSASVEAACAILTRGGH